MTVLFVLALLAVILRTALLSVPEIFAGGAALGGVIYDLAIAYVAAWFFNLLVVILPGLRDRERIMEGAAPLLQRLCAIGLGMPGMLGLRSRDFTNLENADQLGQFRLRIQDVVLMDESNAEYYTAGELRPALWHEWIVNTAKRATNICQSLVPYFPYFESELIQPINRIALSRFLGMARQLGRLREPGGNMRIYVDPLAEFITACRDLQSYYDAKVAMQETISDGEDLGGEILIAEG